MKDPISRKRIYNMITIFLIMAVFSFVSGIMKGILLDQLLCILILDFIFFAMLAFLLEQQRLAGKLFQNRTTDYKYVRFGVILSSITGVICIFLPEFCRPVLGMGLILTGYCSEWLGLCISIYYCVVLAFLCQMSVNELLCYFILVLMCGMSVAAWENAKLKKSFILIIGCLQTIVPTLFYYLEYHKFKLDILIFSFLSGVIWTIMLQFIYERIHYLCEHEVDHILQKMLSGEFSLATELRQFSSAEYGHAKKVSLIARECSRIVGADEILCAAGGLYYRIGILNGEEIAENGILIASEMCFPEKVYQIIREYQGVLELPSTPESAIVQMADSVLCCMEELRTNNDSNTMNKETVICQTMADLWKSGMYDNAGISTNKFLEICEYLAKEDSLL